MSLAALKGFIGPDQMSVLRQNLRGEEGDYFRTKLAALAATIAAMPTTGQTDGQEQVTAHLHYFAGGQASWYITERDKGSPDDGPEDFQSQAFGLADLFGDGGELGYISIPEILRNGGELDLYWQAKTLEQIQEG